MKKTLLILSLLFLTISQVIAGDRTEQQMKESAAKVLNSGNKRAASIGELKELLSMSKLKLYGYDDGGFAIVTTDDQFNDIIGYSTTAFKDSLPCGLKWWLEAANKAMLQGHHDSSSKAKRRSMGSVSPFVSTIWGQQRPYNDELTYTYNGSKYEFVTGCVATAMAQLMNYYKYPASGAGSYSYDITYNNSFTVTFSADFGNSVYDWDNMLDSYEAYSYNPTTDAHTKAVAKLMKDCGVAVHMRYSDWSHGSSASLDDAVSAFKTYFKYDNTTKLYSRSKYGNNDWMNLIYNEIGNGRPIIYRGSDENGNNGHAFVLHGYDSTGKIYINWGWEGYCDGFYDLDILTPDNFQFSYLQDMLITKPGNYSDNTTFHTLTITANGKGSVSFDNENGTLVREESKSFNLIKGGKAKLTFLPDDGCKIKYVKINGTDVTSTIINNSYTIENINSNTTASIEFEEDNSGFNIRQYISVANTGGSISQTNNLINSGSKLNWQFSNNSNVNVLLKSLQLIDGTGAEGNIMAVNQEVDAHSSVAYTITLGSSMHTPLTCRFRYEYNGAVYIADAVYGEPQGYTLTIKSTGNGSVTYNGNSIREKTSTFNVNNGSSATLTFTPDNDNKIKSVTVNGTNITSQINNNQYTISNINKNTTVDVVFEAVPVTPKVYKLTYMVDGAAYKTYNVEEGAKITPEPAPTKEGYTFSGWSEIPKTMPAKDVTVTGTFTINKYKLVYKVDGKEYKSYEVEFGAKITPEPEPTKEGYTFSGWSEIPKTMPAKDVTVTGTFSINKYKLVYKVDGKEYKSYDVEFGAKITPEPAPTKEGYTFSGWSEIPKTMPAKDVTVTGTFTINKYKLVYKVDGKEYKSYDIEFGAKITAEPEPTKEGYTFSGWSEIPKTMPAKDVTVTGAFSINKYKLVYKVDGKEYKSYDIEYGAKITAEPKPTKEGYTFSGWSEIPKTMPAKDVTVTGTFTINKYKLVYKVDGKEYKSYDVEFGAKITPEPAPTKEGYTFSGWSEIPKTMPAKDVTVTGTFSINKYKLVYKVDGKEYKSYDVEFGAKITPEPEPTKEGYTFSGWSEIPKTMPAKDVTVTGTFTINKYKLVYKVDGKEYKSYDVEFGAKITPEPEPTKEGYTFSGWSEIPKTMPAKDVTVTGTFSINKYKLVYKVDGKEYKSYEVEFGAKITPEPEPTKEGYTFSGWSEIPKTMPAKDITVTGTFTINKYKLVYKVDGKEYKSYEVEFGAKITPEPEPTKEGYTFSGWSEIPKTMPAKDVTVTGTFTINKYKLVYKVDGKEYKSYEVEFGAKITPEPEPTKEGYTFSGWSEIPKTMPAKDVTVTGTFTKGAYKLIYMVDGEVYKTVSYDYGANITPEPAPTKEGYTFSGWSEIPKTMPAKDVTVTGTFTINKYKLVYKVDGKEYKSYEVEFGANITPEPAPTKEGYTFSGWSDIPKTMPAKDVTVTGTFTINKYKLIYKIDGKEYKSYEIEFGAKITPETEPTKEGYTFSGWSEIPKTMPAKDVTVTGTFKINKYKLVYKVDGKEYKSYEIEYGAKITPEAEPTKEGYAFSGWSEIPKTMPAHDVEVTGSFTQIVFEIDNLTYEITEEGTVAIIGGKQTGEVTIGSIVVINGKTYEATAIADNAFKDNKEITSLTISEGITTIGDNAFFGCTGLTVINIGKDVKSIGSRAFANVGTASAVRTRSDEASLVVNCYTESVPQTASDAFENTPIETGKLLVNDNLVDAYKSALPWCRFGKIFGFNDPAGINAITIGTANAHIYDMQGNRLDKARKGVNIIRTRDGKTKKVMVK